MTDPTIPELVARLRELRAKVAAGTWIHDTCQGKNAVLCSGAPGIAIPWSRRLTFETAQFIAELVNALPTLLDALERFTAPPPDLTPDTTNPPSDERRG